MKGSAVPPSLALATRKGTWGWSFVSGALVLEAEQEGQNQGQSINA
jgi:hypothetical protein